MHHLALLQVTNDNGESGMGVMSQPNLDKIEPIPSRKILMIVNHFVVSTTDFVNKLLVHCEHKLGKISVDVQRLEILLRILEGKLDSIDWLKAQVKQEEPAPPAPAAAQENENNASGAPPPPSGIPPPPGGAAAAAAAAPHASTAAPEEKGPRLKDDPRFVKYFRMLNFGVPRHVIEIKMKQEGVDPGVLSLDPEGPAPAGGAVPAAPAPAAPVPAAPTAPAASPALPPPPSMQAPAPAPAAASTAGLDAESKALVTADDGSSEDDDDDDDFD
uniref:WASH complex subunit 3 n=1 Tax=Lotharella globosa TaxID=91324 RepID=A0A7S3YG00_9EUKA